MKRRGAPLRIRAWRLWTFVRRHPVVFSIGAALLVVELVIPSDAAGWVLLAALALTAVKGILDLILPAFKDSKEIRTTNSLPRTNGPARNKYAHPYRDWKTLKFGRNRAIHDPTLDLALANGRTIEIRRKTELWLPDEENEKVRKLMVSTLDFDEDKVRLESDLLSETEIIDVRRTKYSAFLVTNRLASYEYHRQDSSQEVLRLQDVGLDVNGRVPRLAASKCSNHVGVDLIAITEDAVLLQRQNDRNHLSAGKLASSGSGSADWADLGSSPDTLTGFVRRAMTRETHEELGSSGLEISKLKVLGYARLTTLAGKPQFYGIAKLKATNPTFKDYERRYVREVVVETFEAHNGVRGLLDTFDRIEKRHQEELSFPLYLNIQMIRQWIRLDPLAAEWLELGSTHR